MSAAALRDADVVHLCFRPPDEPGSYNALVGALVHHDGPLRQVAISYSATGTPSSDDRVVLVGPEGQAGLAGAGLRLPERLRRTFYGGIGSRERIAYATAAVALLDRYQPPVVVIWDDHKLAAFLRRSTEVRSTLVLSQHGRSYHLDPAAARALYRLDTVDAVITLTRASYRADREDLYAYEPLVLVRPNGVDPDTFSPPDEAARQAARSRWALPATAPVALALARLAPSKGAHLLVHSWPRVLEEVPDAVLWLVGGDDGDGTHGDRLRALVDGLGLQDHVRFQGAVPRSDVAGCHAAADLYVFPSVQDEGHPLSLLEALSSGMACVAAASPVVEELHGDVVELVPDPNVEDAFVGPVTRLLGDPHARASLGGAARAQVLERFTLDEYLRETAAFLARLARPGRR